MPKLPKKIRNLTDLRAAVKVLGGPDLGGEAARRIIEAAGITTQVAKFYEPMLLARMEQDLDDPESVSRARAARIVLGAFEAEALRLLEMKPELGIERGRETVRDRKKKLEAEEKLHPPN